MTALAPENQQAQEFPNDIRTAAVVLINLNVNDKRLIPQGIPWVTETPREDRPKHAAGRRLFKSLGVDTSEILQDILSDGFIPVQLQAVDRKEGFRVSIILVSPSANTEGRPWLPPAQMHRISQMLEANAWDVTAYRNPGDGGGNFSLELGNPLEEMGSSYVLCVCEDEALGVVRR